MRAKTSIVVLHEYRRLVLARQFLFGLLIVPLIFGLFVGLIMLMGARGNENDPIGYVDNAGMLTETVPKSVRDRYAEPLTMISFPSEGAAVTALKAKKIQAYYVVSADYVETNRVELVYENDHGEEINRQFADFLRVNLLKDTEPRLANRALQGSNVTVRLSKAGREFTGSPTFGQILPLIASAGFMFLILIATPYLTQIITVERENRLIEILATSLSSGQLIIGKVGGIMAVIFTQFTLWIVLAIGAIGIGRSLGYAWLSDIQIDPPVLLLMIGLLIPAFLMISGIIAAIGAVLSSAEASQQIAATFGIIVMLLMTLVPFVMQDPGGPVAVGMSLFPLSAAMTLPIRVVISDVPAWQIGASLGILISSALFSVWVAGRSLRLGMRSYGKRLRLSDIVRRSQTQAGGPRVSG